MKALVKEKPEPGIAYRDVPDPPPKHAVHAKFALNVAKLQPGHADKIIALASGIENQPDLGPLMQLLRF